MSHSGVSAFGRLMIGHVLFEAQTMNGAVVTQYPRAYDGFEIPVRAI